MAALIELEPGGLVVGPRELIAVACGPELAIVEDCEIDKLSVGLPAKDLRIDNVVAVLDT